MRLPKARDLRRDPAIAAQRGSAPRVLEIRLIAGCTVLCSTARSAETRAMDLVCLIQLQLDAGSAFASCLHRAIMLPPEIRPARRTSTRGRARVSPDSVSPTPPPGLAGPGKWVVSSESGYPPIATVPFRSVSVNQDAYRHVRSWDRATAAWPVSDSCLNQALSCVRRIRVPSTPVEQAGDGGGPGVARPGTCRRSDRSDAFLLGRRRVGQ